MKSPNLTAMIETYMAAAKGLNAPKSLPKEPPKMKICYSLEEWDSHVSETESYNKALREHDARVAKLENDMKAADGQICNYIPAPHVWFISECGKYAVAIQKTNWGGGTKELLIERLVNKSEKDLPELNYKHF